VGGLLADGLYAKIRNRSAVKTRRAYRTDVCPLAAHESVLRVVSRVESLGPQSCRPTRRPPECCGANRLPVVQRTYVGIGTVTSLLEAWNTSHLLGLMTRRPENGRLPTVHQSSGLTAAPRDSYLDHAGLSAGAPRRRRATGKRTVRARRRGGVVGRNGWRRKGPRVGNPSMPAAAPRKSSPRPACWPPRAGPRRVRPGA
jgi:hypothetical protein